MNNEKLLVENALSWLGLEVKDRVTAFSGIISSISFDISGCIQGFVRPTELDKDNKMKDGYWLDLNRLRILTGERLLEPDFSGVVLAHIAHGPETKTDPSTGLNKGTV